MPPDEEVLPPDPDAGAPPEEEYVPPEGASTVPLETFNSTYGKFKGAQSQLKQFEEFGTPDEIRASLAKLSKYNEGIEEIERRRALSADEKAQATKDTEIKAQLEKYYPGLKDLDKIGELSESATARNLADASTRLSGFLKVKNVVLDPKDQSTLEDFILYQLGPDGGDKLSRGDFSGLESAVEGVLKSPMFSHLVKTPDPNLPPAPVPPAQHKPGGAAPAPPSKGDKPMSWDEAGNAAWEKIPAHMKGA